MTATRTHTKLAGVNAKDLTDDQRAALVAELDRHRVCFYRLSARMKARKWFIDSAVLNAVEAAWQATSAAINAIKAETKESVKVEERGFQLPPPSR